MAKSIEEKPTVTNTSLDLARGENEKGSDDIEAVSSKGSSANEKAGGHESDEVDDEAKRKLEALHLDPDHAAPATREEKRATLRKIDMVMMPMMCLSVFLQYLDKSSLNYANLLGIQTDLGLHGQQYSWLGSIFYIGYLVASPLHGFFMQKLPLTRYVGVCIIFWGTTLALHATCFNYAGLVACRLFLGIFEAALTPAFILITGRFYRSKEQVARTSIWFMQNGTAQILGGAISYGVQTQKPGKLKVWQQLYVILGVITFVYGIVVFFFMPEKPETSKLLTPRQRIVALERIRENKTGLHDRKFKKEQLYEALLDVRLYLFFFAVASSNVSNGVSSNFSSVIIKGLGFDNKKAALVGMSTGLAELVAIILGIFVTRLTGTRVVPGVFSFLVAIIGGAMLIGVKDKITELAGYNLIFFFPVASPLLYSWLSSAVAGTTKKIVFNVVLQLGYCAGNIIGPQTALQRESPQYTTAKIVMLIMFVISACCLSAIGLVHLLWNRSRNAKNEGQDDPKLAELADHTDKELRSFRYPY